MKLKKVIISTLLFATVCTITMSNVTNASTNDDLEQMKKKYEGLNVTETSV